MIDIRHLPNRRLPVSSTIGLCMLLSLGTGSQAGPNNVCADLESFQQAQAMVKDQTPFGKQLQASVVDKLVQMGAPKDYTASRMVNDLKRKGPERYVDDLLAITRQIDIAKGLNPTTVEHDIASARTSMLEGLRAEVWLDTFDLFDRYLIVDQPPVATDYNRDLQRVTCTFSYHINADLIRRHADRHMNSQEARMAAQAAAILNATKATSSAIYSVQPDGRGGSTLILLQAQ